MVTRLTLRTRDLPEFAGGVFGEIHAKSDEAFRKLIARVIGFYHDHLFNRHWGEKIEFETGNRLEISMMSQGMNRQKAVEIWRPFLDWVKASPEDFSMPQEVTFLEIPARHLWDYKFIRKMLPSAISFDDRPGAPRAISIGPVMASRRGWCFTVTNRRGCLLRCC